MLLFFAMDYYLLLCFFNTLAVNYLVFYLITSFFRAETAIWRLMIAGGVYAAVSVFGVHLDTDVVLLKCIVSVIGILVSKEDFTFMEFCRFASLYAVIRLMLAGAEELLGDYIGSDAFDIAISAAVVLCVLLFRAATGLHGVRDRRSYEYKVEVSIGNTSKVFKGFVDTGNALYKEGKPVIVISDRVRSKAGLKASDTITVGTLTGVKELPATMLTYKIYYDKKTHKLYNSFAVISDKMELRGYDVLLHKDMLK